MCFLQSRLHARERGLLRQPFPVPYPSLTSQKSEGPGAISKLLPHGKKHQYGEELSPYLTPHSANMMTSSTSMPSTRPQAGTISGPLSIFSPTPITGEKPGHKVSCVSIK